MAYVCNVGYTTMMITLLSQRSQALGIGPTGLVHHRRHISAAPCGLHCTTAELTTKDVIIFSGACHGDECKVTGHISDVITPPHDRALQIMV
jgi:hypothetical protein